MMNKIFCLLGGCAVGKDTVRSILLQDYEQHFVPAVSTTTRPPRKGEVDGVHYYFEDDKAFNFYKDTHQFVEMREYTTATGEVWRYGYTYHEIEDKLAQNNILIIADLAGFMDFKVIYGEQAVGIYLQLDRDTRVQRYLNRDVITFELVEEAVRRIKDDDERAFLVVDQWVDKTFNNHDSKTTAKEIVDYLIQEELIK